MIQDWQSHTQVTTTSVGLGDLVLSATGTTPAWQAFTALLDGKLVDVEIEHTTAPFEVENGRYLYEHATLTLKRSLGGTEWGNGGAFVPTDFSPGTKLVSITVNGRTLRELVLFRGGGRTINEDVDFVAGGTFTVDLANARHRSLKVMGVGDGALTQNVTVALPDPDTAQWGDEIYVEKGEASLRTVVVLGFDNDEVGTHSLRRQDQYITAKLVGTTERKWERTRGGQQSPSAKGQDIIRATNPETQLVSGGAVKIRDATASQDGLMTAAYAAQLDSIADGLAYVPTNYTPI